MLFHLEYLNMINIPNEIIQKIILQQIILVKNINGWKDIHYYINKNTLVLKLTVNQYPYEMQYETIVRSTVPEKPFQVLKRNKYIWNSIQNNLQIKSSGWYV